MLRAMRCLRALALSAVAATASAAPIELAPRSAPGLVGAGPRIAAAAPAAALLGAPALSPTAVASVPISLSAAAAAPAPLAAAAAAARAAAAPVSAIGLEGDAYSVNGRPASVVGWGDFKEVVEHPDDPELVVKIFYSKWTSSVPEMLREVGDVSRLQGLGVVPTMIQSGSVPLRGQATGFLVQERVRGTTLERTSAGKLSAVRALFARLTDAGLELGDVKAAFKLRSNIMVGSTRSVGTRAWLVDPEVRRSRRSRRELDRFYDVLLARIVRDR